MYSPVLCEREQSGSAGTDRRASGYGDRTMLLQLIWKKSQKIQENCHVSVENC